MISRAEAIDAYSAKQREQYSLALMEAHQADVEDRTKVAENANEALGLVGNEELVWNELPVVMIGTQPVFYFTIDGYEFYSYYSRSRRYGREQYVVLRMKVAPWARFGKMSIDAVESEGWESVHDAASFGRAVLIHSLEAQMPDRLSSKNPKIANTRPINIKPSMAKKLGSEGRSIDPDRYWQEDNDVEMYRRMLELYQAERGAIRFADQPKTAAVDSQDPPKKRGPWIWSK